MQCLSMIAGQLAWGDAPLLDKADFAMEAGERVGLIGRNGTGKSSFMKVLAGQEMLDGGTLQRLEGLRAVYVEQEPAIPEAATLLDAMIARGRPAFSEDERAYWQEIARLEEYFHKFSLRAGVDPAKASGGEKKRAALALALSLQPDLLLLDEPTNHLDVEAIEALERMLLADYRNSRSLVVVTHDRAFLDAVATRIEELDRGALRSYPGNFTAYEERKAKELEDEQLANQRFDKFLSQEEVWIRKGIEARRTRNEGRVRRLERLRVLRQQRRERIGRLDIKVDDGGRSGKVVAELTGVSKRFGDRQIVKGLDFTLMRGDKLGLIGRNGAGKSTLIKLFLGELAADEGEIKLGTNLRVAYFDQLRDQLDVSKTVAETISPGGEWIEIGGARKHVMSYLSDFLFPAHRAHVPVASLSGGERNRLLLARLFALPANLLVLDEPTNDLDIESLEVLESTIASYDGTVILVSHDRRFLDGVVTEVLAPVNHREPDGRWMEFVGGYADWEKQRPAVEKQPAAPSEPKPAAGSYKKVRASERKVRLSFKERQELEELPPMIEGLERENEALVAKMSLPGYHKLPVGEQQADKERMDAIPGLVEQAYARWEALLAKQAQEENG